MEYYLIVTKACNLECSFCSGVNIGSNLYISNETIKDACLFMLQNNNSKNGIVFYGGEPLLAQEEIIKIIDGTKVGDFDYILHTNGVLLDKIDLFILEHIDALFVSIDGNKDVIDRYKGKGVFDKIIRNLEKLRPIFNGMILARITVPIRGYYDNKYSLNYSIRNLYNTKLFDSVHWQIENSPYSQENIVYDAFLKGYIEDIKDLIEFWISNLQDGNILNIVPIQTLVSELINVNICKTFPCGCIDRLVVIDIDGECYLCDELVGNANYRIGNITKGIKFPKDNSCNNVNENCAICEYAGICGGRCLNSCQLYPKNVFSFYCSATKLLIDSVKIRLPEIIYLLRKNSITLDSHGGCTAFQDRYTTYTEKRP